MRKNDNRQQKLKCKGQIYKSLRMFSDHVPTKFPVTFLTESTNHIWCNRHLFSLKQHIPSANGLCLTQKYHYHPRGHCKSKHADCRFDPAQLLIARSLSRGLGGIVRLLTFEYEGVVYSASFIQLCLIFWGKFIITPNISSVNKSFKKYFSHSFSLDSMRFCAFSCARKNKTRIYPIE